MRKNVIPLLYVLFFLQSMSANAVDTVFSKCVDSFGATETNFGLVGAKAQDAADKGLAWAEKCTISYPEIPDLQLRAIQIASCQAKVGVIVQAMTALKLVSSTEGVSFIAMNLNNFLNVVQDAVDAGLAVLAQAAGANLPLNAAKNFVLLQAGLAKTQVAIGSMGAVTINVLQQAAELPAPVKGGAAGVVRAINNVTTEMGKLETSFAAYSTCSLSSLSTVIAAAGGNWAAGGVNGVAGMAPNNVSLNLEGTNLGSLLNFSSSTNRSLKFASFNSGSGGGGSPGEGSDVDASSFTSVYGWLNPLKEVKTVTINFATGDLSDPKYAIEKRINGKYYSFRDAAIYYRVPEGAKFPEDVKSPFDNSILIPKGTEICLRPGYAATVEEPTYNAETNCFEIFWGLSLHYRNDGDEIVRTCEVEGGEIIRPGDMVHCPMLVETTASPTQIAEGATATRKFEVFHTGFDDDYLSTKIEVTVPAEGPNDPCYFWDEGEWWLDITDPECYSPESP